MPNTSRKMLKHFFCVLCCVRLGYPCETLDLHRVGKRRQSQPAVHPWELDSSTELDDAQLAALIAATAGVNSGPTSLAPAAPAALNDSQQVLTIALIRIAHSTGYSLHEKLLKQTESQYNSIYSNSESFIINIKRFEQWYCFRTRQIHFCLLNYNDIDLDNALLLYCLLIPHL